MIYRTISVGKLLEDANAWKHHESLYDVNFDDLLKLDRDIPVLLFVDFEDHEQSGMNDWLFAFNNIVLMNGIPARAFVLKGYSEEREVTEGYFRVISGTGSARQLYSSLSSKINRELERIAGSSQAMTSLKRLIVLSMFYDGSTMIVGETGTGKNHFAEVITALSPRGPDLFFSINCAAIPDNLLESELFGYRKGSFTGASSDKKGLVEMANTGTLFLDEIGDMPLNLQAKILRITENREFFKIGATTATNVDVRFITATNKYDDSSLRDDLRYRLSSIVFNLPPLRYRKSDIPVMFDHIMSSKGYLVRFDNLPPEMKNDLIVYDYPGNIRELGNIIEEYLAMNKITRTRVTRSYEEIVSTLADRAMMEYTNGTQNYRDFLAAVQKTVSQEILRRRVEVVGNSASKLSKEFGLTPRRMRDLLSEMNEQELSAD